MSERLRTLGVALRPARAGDLPFLRALFESFRAGELALVPWSAAQKAAFLDDQFRLQHLHFTRVHAGGDFWVLVQGPARIGRLYLDRSGPNWRIVDIGLVSQARGHGLGSALIEWIKSAATQAGAEGVALAVAANNPRARALYLRRGFREKGGGVGSHLQMLWRPGIS
jgi:ribosomal protein S18 acetylase RimI-like enzyme